MPPKENTVESLAENLFDRFATLDVDLDNKIVSHIARNPSNYKINVVLQESKFLLYISFRLAIIFTGSIAEEKRRNLMTSFDDNVTNYLSFTPNSEHLLAEKGELYFGLFKHYQNEISQGIATNFTKAVLFHFGQFCKGRKIGGPVIIDDFFKSISEDRFYMRILEIVLSEGLFENMIYLSEVKI